MNKHSLTFECPKCQHTDTIEVPDSINANKDPMEYQNLLNGEFFETSCRFCGSTISLTYNLLFHDPNHKAMAFYCPDDKSIKEAEESIQKASSLPAGAPLSNYTLRIVTNEKALSEKALIWSLGYDDKAVEIWKLTYLYHVLSHKKDFQSDASYLTKNDNGYDVDFYYEGKYLASISGDISLLPDVMTRFLSKDVNDDSYYINQEWAKDHLSKLLHRPD